MLDKYIVEYGHYYKTQGPTLGTQQSISVFETLKNNGYFGNNVFTVLFIDDVHPTNPHEPHSDKYDIDFKALKFDLEVLESRTKIVALQLIQSLQSDPDLQVLQEGSKKYLKNGSKTQIELSDEKNPSCVMMDAALTLLKFGNKTGSGNKIIVNILPESYRKQQQNLHKVISELFRIGVIKEQIHLKSVLFNKELTSFNLLETIHKVVEKSTFSL